MPDSDWNKIDDKINTIDNKINGVGERIADLSGWLRGALPHLATHTSVKNEIAKQKQLCKQSTPPPVFQTGVDPKKVGGLIAAITSLTSAIWAYIHFFD